MIINTAKICDGVTLAACKTDSFKSAQMTVSFAMPLDIETASGYSLLTNIMSLSTGAFPTMQDFSVKKDELYALGLDAFVQRRGETLLLTFELCTISNSYAFSGEDVLDEAVALLGDAIFNPLLVDGAFPTEAVETEKLCLIEEIESVIETKPSYALLRARQIMCENEPFAVDAAGDVERVKALDGKKLLPYYNNILSHAPVIITYVGEEDIDRVAETVKRHLKFAPRDGVIPEAMLHVSSDFKRVTEYMDMEQSVLVLGFSDRLAKTPRERAILTVFDEIFGGSPASKLFVNVREKQGLCYFCSSMPVGSKNVLFVSCGLENGSEGIAEEAILREISAMKRGDFSNEDIETAKISINRGLESIGCSLSSVGNYLTGRTLRNDDTEIDELMRLVSSVTREEIIEFANTLTHELTYILASEEPNV